MDLLFSNSETAVIDGDSMVPSACEEFNDRSAAVKEFWFKFITLKLVHFATSFFGLFNPKSTPGSLYNPVLQRVLLIHYLKVARYVFKIRRTAALEDADCNALEFDDAAVSYYACDDDDDKPESFPEHETLMENLRSVLSKRNQIVDACRQGFGGDELTPALLNVFRILSFDAGNVSVCQFLSCMTTIGDSDGEYKSFSQRLADKFSRIFTTTTPDDSSMNNSCNINGIEDNTPSGDTMSLSDDDDGRGFQYAVQKFYCELATLKCVHFAVSFFEIFGSEEEEDNANPPAAGGGGGGVGQRLCGGAFQRVLLGHFEKLMLGAFKLRKRYGDMFADQRIRFTDPPTENGYAPERSVSAVAVDDIPSYTALMNNLTDYVSNQSKFFDAYHRGYGETAPTISKSFLTNSSVREIINSFVSFADSKNYKAFSKGLTGSFNQFSVAAAAAGTLTPGTGGVRDEGDRTLTACCWSGVENAEKRDRFVSNVQFYRLSKGFPVSEHFRIRLNASSFSGLKDEKFKYVADFVLSKTTPFSVLQYLYEKAVLNCPIRCGEELAKWGRDVFSTVQRPIWSPLCCDGGREDDSRKLTQSIMFDEAGDIKLTFWFVKERISSASVLGRRQEEVFGLTILITEDDVRYVYLTSSNARNFVFEKMNICDIKDPIIIDSCT